MRIVQQCWSLLLSLVMALLAGSAMAQTYPTKPVHIFTTLPGASADMLSRLLASAMSPSLGQPVVVENRPAGPILATSVSKAAPDGHTLLIWAGGVWLGPVMEPTSYELRDFSPVTLLTRSPNVLVVHPSVPARSLAELIKLVKAQPGKLNYTSGTNGSSSHLAGELFKSMTATNIVRVPYKSSAQELADLVSGQVQMTFGNITSMGPQIKAGKLIALASGGPARSVLFPDIPAVVETLPGFVSEQYFALWAPAKTPSPVITRLNQEARRVLDRPEVRAQLLNSALEAAGGTPEQLLELANSEVARVSKLIKDIGLKPGGS